MDGKSVTPESIKLQQLREILPEVFVEGKVDWEKLKATLGEDINFANERYVLNWAGKSEAFKVLQTPTTKTLIPDAEESVNFDTTQNIFIEGENLEVLKVLQKSYFGKVKMIYIDPPYNTGNDSFIYPDKFSESKYEYEQRVGDKDEKGYLKKDGMLRKNSKENGQYHSNWLNMMYPRLFLAKNLLRKDGVIFVSIDDNEVHNLRMIMNEVFGEENFVSKIIWKKNKSGNQNSRYIATQHDYIIAFVNMLNSDRWKVAYSEQDLKDYNEKDKKGYYYFKTVKHSTRGNTISLTYKNNEYEIESSIYSKDKLIEMLGNGDAIFRKNKNGNFQLYKKQRVGTGTIPYSILNAVKFPMTENGVRELQQLLGADCFDNPKPHYLIKYLISICTKNNSLILDFFAGSGTTAHAVMQLNAEDSGKRRCISVQLPEVCNEKSEAYKAGYKTIADIAKERIRRAANKIQANVNEKIIAKAKEILELERQLDIDMDVDTKEEKINCLKLDIEKLRNQDLGFKVLKLSNSNFKQWRQIQNNNIAALEKTNAAIC